MLYQTNLLILLHPLIIPLLLHQQHHKTPSLSPLHSQIPSFPRQPLTNPNQITIITKYLIPTLLPIMITTRFKIDGHQSSRIPFPGMFSPINVKNSLKMLLRPVKRNNPKKHQLAPGVHFDLQHAPLIITTELRSGITHGKLERYKHYTVYQRSVRLGRS